MTADEMAVVLDGERAGTAFRSESSVRFEYGDGYLASARGVPLSVGAPLSAGKGHQISHWIDGLLPDDRYVRFKWQDSIGAASDAPFDLLSAGVGWDCPGAFQFCAVSDFDAAAARDSGLIPLDDAAVGESLRRLREDPAVWHISPDGLEVDVESSFSLAGAQSKIALREGNDGWSLPYGDEPTTSILKPAPGRFEDLDLLECLAQRAAARVGMLAAETGIVFADGERALMSRRYDRRAASDGRVRRIHQEDLCQALGLPPRRKVERLGGPGAADVGALLRRVSAKPEDDLGRFFEALFFNWMIGGVDAHAKNYSLLISGHGLPRLAPLYDLCPMSPYLEVGGGELGDAKMSMRVGGQDTIGGAETGAAWAAAASEIGIGRGEAAARMAKLAERLPGAVSEAVADLPPQLRDRPLVRHLAARLPARAETGLRLSRGM